MKLSTRLALAFGALVLLSLLGSAVGLWKLAALNGNLDKVVNENNVKLALGQSMSESVHIVSRVMRTLVLLDDDKQKQAEQAKIDTARADYAKAWEALAKFPPSPAGKAKRGAIEAAASKAKPLNTQVMTLGLAEKDAEAIKLLLAQAAPATAEWQAALDGYIDFQTKRNADEYGLAVADYEQARAVLIVLGLASALVAAVLATLVVRSVVKVLGGEPAEVVEVVRAVAAGDLSRRISVRSGDAGSVMAAVADMQASLTRVVGNVRQNSENVATASAQIAQGNSDLSQRTEEQASALQQTAASMEQLTTTVQNNAANASQANDLALNASQVAERGGEVVGRVVQTMKHINESSRRISDIIGVIDGIAFQTNILALNAAVEAARAGEQGRGFAVVAGEVRVLAGRSAEAAREIKGLITASVESVAQGTALVDEAGATMTEVVGSIRRANEIMAEISTASAQQSAGVAQVGQAIGQMDQVTQQNAALVEESAAAAESLKTQAQGLVQTVAAFRLGGDPR